MAIKGIEGMTGTEVQAAVSRGGTFVVYPYCVSAVLITFRRHSGVYFVPAGQSRFVRGLPFLLISLVFGWWGIPWGPIYTVASLVTNFGGGKDVTREVLQPQPQEPLPGVPKPS